MEPGTQSESPIETNRSFVGCSPHLSIPMPGTNPQNKIFHAAPNLHHTDERLIFAATEKVNAHPSARSDSGIRLRWLSHGTRTRLLRRWRHQPHPAHRPHPASTQSYLAPTERHSAHRLKHRTSGRGEQRITASKSHPAKIPAPPE